MSHLRFISFFLTVLLSAGSLWAQQAQQNRPRPRAAAPAATEPRIPYIYAGAIYHELIMSGSSAVFSNGQESKASTEKISRISLDLDYRYQLFQAVQAGVQLGLQSVSGGNTSYSCMDTFGTLSYNFSDAWNISNSLYTTGALGMADESCGLKGSNKKTAFFIAIGKRFQIFEHVHFMPEFGGRKVGENDAILYAKLLNFSIGW